MFSWRRTAGCTCFMMRAKSNFPALNTHLSSNVWKTRGTRKSTTCQTESFRHRCLFLLFVSVSHLLHFGSRKWRICVTGWWVKSAKVFFMHGCWVTWLTVRLFILHTHNVCMCLHMWGVCFTAFTLFYFDSCRSQFIFQISNEAQSINLLEGAVANVSNSLITQMSIQRFRLCMIDVNLWPGLLMLKKHLTVPDWDLWVKHMQNMALKSRAVLFWWLICLQ